MQALGFDTALTYVVQNEGEGYTDDPVDPGGATRMGITQRTLNNWAISKNIPIIDVKLMSDITAHQVYLDVFWKPLRCDELPYPLALALFDSAVNHGESTAIRLAQSCLIGVKVDGEIGDLTVSALNKTDVENFLFNFIGALQDAYCEVCLHAPSQVVFLKGWLKRTRRLFLLAHE